MTVAKTQAKVSTYRQEHRSVRAGKLREMSHTPGNAHRTSPQP